MKLAGITIFIIAAMTFVNIMGPNLSKNVHNLIEGGDAREVHNLSTKGEAYLKILRATENHTVVRASTLANSLLLVGSPSYGATTFNLPMRAGVSRGVAVFDITAEIEPDVNARVRVNINGERRGEFLVNSGTSKHRVIINLEDRDLAQRQISANLSVVASYATGECSRAWNGGVVIMVEPTSGLEIVTADKITDTIELISTTGSPGLMYWPPAAEGSYYSDLFSYSVIQNQNGNPVEFSLDKEASIDIENERIKQEVDVLHKVDIEGLGFDEWPIFIAEEGPVAKARRFERETDWRMEYSVRNTPNSEVPQTLELDLDVKSIDPESRWLLDVTLNGSSVYSHSVESGSFSVDEEIALPYRLHAYENSLHIMLRSAVPINRETCSVGQPALAQVNSASILTNGRPFLNNWSSEVISLFFGNWEMGATSGLSAVDVNSAVSFVSLNFTGELYGAGRSENGNKPGQMIAVSRDQLPAQIESAREKWPDATLWIMWPDNTAENGYSHRNVTYVSDWTAPPRYALLLVKHRES